MENKEIEAVAIKDQGKKHYGMPLSKATDIAQGLLSRIASYYEEDDEEARAELNEMIEKLCEGEACQGDSKDFHNLVVSLAREEEYSLACDVIECGLKSFPKNVDLLADFLQYGIRCGRSEQAAKYYKLLKRIPARRYTWRGFSFQMQYLQFLLEQSDSEKALKTLENELLEVADKFKEINPYSEEPYVSEAELYRSLNMADKEEEILKEALNKLPVCPKCSLRYADLMLELGRYDEAKKAAERGKNDAVQPQASVSEGYIYYLSALCTIADVCRSGREYEEREVLDIYSDFNLALKELKGNKTYVNVIKSKTNVLMSKTRIKVSEEDFEELFDAIL